MKQYLLFGGDIYYASGGMHDFRGSFATIDEARARIDKRIEQADPLDWWHIYDIETMKIVARSSAQAY